MELPGLYQPADAKVHFVPLPKRKKRENGKKPVKISRRLNIYLRRIPLAAAEEYQGWQGARQALPKDRNRYRNCRPPRNCTSLLPTDLPAISSPRSRVAVAPLGSQKYPRNTVMHTLKRLHVTEAEKEQFRKTTKHFASVTEGYKVIEKKI